MASSVFSMYILHGEAWSLIRNTLHALESSGNTFTLMAGSFALVIVIMIVCVAIDTAFSPLWTFIFKKTKWLDERYK